MSTKAEFSDSDFEPVIVEDEDQTCNYCNRRTPLMHDKPYCARCHGMMFRECKRCHKPYHLARHFEKDEVRCNSCFEKLQRERLKRALKKRKNGAAADEEDDDPFTVGPSKPKKKAADAKSAPATTTSADVRLTLFSELPDLKDAKVAYLPIFLR